MSFKQYLQALESGDIEKWVLENMTNGSKFSKFSAMSIIKQAFSDGYCPIDKFHIYYKPEEMVFGQFIGIETTLNSTVGMPNRLLSLAKNILRPKGDILFDNEDTEKEELNTENILNHPCENIMRVVNKFTEARNEFVNVKYGGVFYRIPDEDDDEPDDSSVSNDDGNWYWYSLIRTLSKENIHDYSNTIMLPMSEVAVEVAYLRKEEQKAEYQRKVDEVKQRTGKYGNG